MHAVTIHLDPYLIYFYQQVANRQGLCLEQVLQDALFKLAGELSLEAISLAENPHYPPS